MELLQLAELFYPPIFYSWPQTMFYEVELNERMFFMQAL